MNTILQFAFETGDIDPAYYQIYIVVHDDCVDYSTLEDSISSYMDSNYNEDNEFEDIVEDIMRESGFSWEFMNGIVSGIRNIYTFWI